jgi:hypothetical protein
MALLNFLSQVNLNQISKAKHTNCIIQMTSTISFSDIPRRPFATMQENGQFVIYTEKVQVYSIRSAVSPGAFLYLLFNGNLVVGNDSTVLWASNKFRNC